MIAKDDFRSFEYLAATSPSGTTRSPGKASFTSALIWALEELLLKDRRPKFTTTELRLKIKDAPEFPKDQTPMLKSRDVSSIERIVLGPLPPSDEKPPSPEEDSSSPNTECLMLRCYFERTPTREELKSLARCLQRHISTQKSPLTRVAYGGLHSLEQRAAMMFLESLNRKKSTEISHPLQLSAVIPDASPRRVGQKLDIQQEAKPKQTNDNHCAEKEEKKELHHDEVVDEPRMRGPSKRKKVIH